MSISVEIEQRLEAWHVAARTRRNLEREHRASYRMPRLDDTSEQRQAHENKVVAFNAAHAAESDAHVAIWELASSGAALFALVRARYCASIREHKQRGDYYGGYPMGACAPEEIRV